MEEKTLFGAPKESEAAQGLEAQGLEAQGLEAQGLEAQAASSDVPPGWTEKEAANGKSYSKSYDRPVEANFYAGRAKSALQDALASWTGTRMIRGRRGGRGRDRGVRYPLFPCATLHRSAEIQDSGTALAE